MWRNQLRKFSRKVQPNIIAKSIGFQLKLWMFISLLLFCQKLLARKLLLIRVHLSFSFQIWALKSLGERESATTFLPITSDKTEVIGKKVVADSRSPKLFIPDMGIDPKTIDPYLFSVAEAGEQIEDGRMSYIGEVKDDVQILLNRKGLSVSQWAEIHKTEFIKLIIEKEDKDMNWGKTV